MLRYMISNDWYHTEKRPRGEFPLCGTLIIDGKHHCSDGNIYARWEVHGVAKPGKYPLYAHIRQEYNHETRTYGKPYCDYVYAHVPGVSYDGKEEFSHTFHLYSFSVNEYIGGKEIEWYDNDRSTVTIVLDPPFVCNGKDVDGYTPEMAQEFRDWYSRYEKEHNYDSHRSCGRDSGMAEAFLKLLEENEKKDN